MQEKLLTLIIPSYNAEPFLQRGLDSFLIEEPMRQLLEVWIIDDGSKDQTAQIAKSYVERDPELFFYHHKENGGHGSAINAGVKLARGKFFKVIDADDWVEGSGLVQFMQELKTCDCDVAISNYREYDISKRKYTDRRTRLAGESLDLSALMDRWAQLHACMAFWGVTYRRDFYLKQSYELLEGVFYEDQEFATIPLSRAEKVYFSDAFVYVYRLGDVNQSVSGANQVKRIGHLAKVIQALVAFEAQAKAMGEGHERYWRKKTSMVLVSYYQICLLVNPDRAQGRQHCEQLNRWLEKKSPELLSSVARKYQIFQIFHRIHMSEGVYKCLVPPVLKLLRHIKIW